MNVKLVVATTILFGILFAQTGFARDDYDPWYEADCMLREWEGAGDPVYRQWDVNVNVDWGVEDSPFKGRRE